MALVWAEPFDQYGGTLALVNNAGYSNVVGAVNQGPGRTGAFCYASNSTGFLQRPLDVPIGTLGMGYAYQPISLTPPTDSFNNNGLRWSSAGNITECTINQLTDNSIGVWDRTNTLVGRTAPNQIVQNTWRWVEAVAIKNSAGINTGQVEVRIQGIQKLVVNGINLPNNFAFHGIGGFSAGFGQYDDWIVWDNTGLYNNTFMGDRRLFYSSPNANGIPQNFVPSAGQAWDCVNNIPPVDTTYIEGAAAGNVSEFQKDLIGIQSTDVAAVVVVGRSYKTDAGVASGRIGIDSVGNINNSAEFFPGTTGAYNFYVIERDPNGNIPWTKAAVDASNIVVTRVS